ncbi:Shikimate kinase, chloroplastic [Orobanche hederae]
METRVFSMGLQLGTWISPGNLGRKPNGSLQFFENHGEQRMYGIPASCHLLAKRCRFHRPEILKVSCSFEKSPGVD